MQERQLTTAAHGHILTNTACWSRDSQWLVYDTRSDAAGSQFDGRFIERVHATTGRVERLFESREGAHCGVVTCCPVTDRIVFIHGPERPTIDWQYAPYHRRGVIVSASGQAENLDAHVYAAPFVAGALRGGSHVHTWDATGKRVAFTYEDHVLATLDRATHPRAERNQRNIGISDPVKAVTVPNSHPRNHAGSHFSVLVTTTVDQPQPGSDQIDRAYEDAWLGRDGRRLAFLGDVVGKNGARFTELFLLELPDDLTQPITTRSVSEGQLKTGQLKTGQLKTGQLSKGSLNEEQLREKQLNEGLLQGTEHTRPRPPRGCVQRRLTYTEDRPQPGIIGPRHWPRSTPDGSHVFCLMSDSHKQPQLFRVSPRDGQSTQVTDIDGGIQSAFSVSPDGEWIVYVAQGSVMRSSTDGQRHERLTPSSDSETQPRPEACVISPDGSHVAYVRRISGFNQIFAAAHPS